MNAVRLPNFLGRILARLGWVETHRWTFVNVEGRGNEYRPYEHFMNGHAAVEWLMTRGDFSDAIVVHSVDHAARVVKYETDYLKLRTKMRTHWRAVRVGDEGGEFKIPDALREEAIDRVTKDGAHSIWYVDDRAAIVFYRVKV